MSWHAPTTIGQMGTSVRAGWAWDWASRDLHGHYVAVCTATAPVDPSHPLSDHVRTGAARYHDDYMAGGPDRRKPHPSVVLYYVRHGNRVVVAVQADGTVLDEIDTTGADLSPRVRDELRAAAQELAGNVRRLWDPWGHYSA